MESLEARIIDLDNPKQTAAIGAFLQEHGLSYGSDVDYTIALYHEDSIVATGSIGGRVLRNIAIQPELQGEGILAKVVSILLQEQSRRGVYHSFLYTLPSKARLFQSLGFEEIVRAEPYAAFLEIGMGSVEEYLGKLKKAVQWLPAGAAAAVVVNCNPFTLGHKALIAQAARENNAVIVFVVSEDRSAFPFQERYRLVQEGVAEFGNVAVVPGGEYIISAATFPGYFTKGKDTVTAQARLDATLFAKRIAPALGITARYVGEEPYCQVTQAYNQALLDILPRHGVMVHVIGRSAVNGELVSASKVRDAIRRNDWDTVKRMVPDTTFEYLVSPAAQPVLEKIRHSDSRH